MRKRWERERREGVPRPHFPEFWTHRPPRAPTAPPVLSLQDQPPVTRWVTAQRRSPLLLNSNAEWVFHSRPGNCLQHAACLASDRLLPQTGPPAPRRQPWAGKGGKATRPWFRLPPASSSGPGLTRITGKWRGHRSHRRDITHLRPGPPPPPALRGACRSYWKEANNRGRN